MKKSLLSIALFCCFSILAQEPAPLAISVRNSKGKPYKGDKVYFVGQTKHDSYAAITDVNGKCNVKLPQGQVYDIKLKSIGDEVEYNTIDVPTLPKGQFYDIMELQITYDASRSFTLSNLNFETNKASIQTSSLAVLNDLLEIMLLKPEMKIEVIGHTDSDGDDTANLALSQQRAEAVKNHLVSKGIAPNRIKATGKGETQPIADNGTTKGKAMNRRTEVNILE